MKSQIVKKMSNESFLCGDNGRFWHFLKLRYIGIAYILPSLTY